MKKTALVISSLFALANWAHANQASVTFPASVAVDDGLAAGLDMMLSNTSQLRNGDNVWQRAREGFQIPEVNPELVRQHERYFATRPDYLKRTLDRSRKYLFHILNEVERRGMPTELAFLPVVESSFVPTARSPVGAEGLWQFMPATGRDFNLEQTWWYDGRRDVLESTRAALDYLQLLNERFGDWNLALAAYNWGQGNLGRAITRVQSRGEEVSYENLTLPAETRNYAPKLLAIRNIMADPAKFGLRIDVLPNKPAFVAVSTGKHMNIEIAAKLAETPLAEIKELNPAFNLPVYAHKSGRQLLLPANKLHNFERNLAKWNKPLLTWQVHVAEGDQDASQLAERFDMNPNELIAVNRLQGSRKIAAGQPLLVAAANVRDESSGFDTTPDSPPAARPVAPDQPVIIQVAASKPAAPVIKPAAPVVVPTPTPAPVVVAVANTPAVPANAGPIEAAVEVRTVRMQQQLPDGSPRIVKVANAITPQAIQPPAPELPSRPVTRVEQHTVATGDTLFNISRRYGMTVAELKNLNGLEADTLKLGQNLRVFGEALGNAPAANIQPASAQLAVAGKPTTTYTVQAGDTVYSIARRFGVHFSDIQRWNAQMTAFQIQPGQVLRVSDQGL